MALLLAAGAAGCEDVESSLSRGDRLWADSSYTAALAEYRLALARNGSPEVMVRVAHGYAVTGQFERAREHYDELLRRAPQYREQAIFDYLDLASRAGERSDRYGMAGAIEAALALQPGLPVEHMTVPLARYYAANGEPERALEFYDRAIAASPPDSVASLLYEMAELHEASGDCRQAVERYNAFLDRAPGDPRASRATYRVGDCSWTLAQSARKGGDPERALFLLETVNSLGAPQAVQDEAWFERGEILLEQGRTLEALDAYTRAIEAARAPRSQLAERARQRIDEIRFGRRQPPPAGQGSNPGAPEGYNAGPETD
jgi:tetratricopeptide (TPR) repeat protein